MIRVTRISLVLFCILLLAGCSIKNSLSEQVISQIDNDKAVIIPREKAISLARSNIEQKEFYKYLPSKKLDFSTAELVNLANKEYWRV